MKYALRMQAQGVGTSDAHCLFLHSTKPPNPQPAEQCFSTPRRGSCSVLFVSFNFMHARNAAPMRPPLETSALAHVGPKYAARRNQMDIVDTAEKPLLPADLRRCPRTPSAPSVSAEAGQTLKS